MELIRSDLNIDFLRRKWLFMGLSGVLILVGIVSLVVKGGPDFGIDFAGGLLVELRTQKPTSPAEVRQALAEKRMGNFVVQNAWELGKASGQDFLIRMDLGEGKPEELSKLVQKALEDHFGKEGLEIRRVEMVGPKVGKELQRKGTWAVILALIAILVYLAWRFEFKYSLGAVTALFHDVMITLGAFSVTGREIDLPIVAAFLTIVGYSVNDTIVIFDRVRENVRKYRRTPLAEIINRSVNETLSRTILTAGTVFITDLALFLFGGGVIHDFAFALLVGIVAGTYSTVFIASPIALAWEQRFGTKRSSAGKA
ncbi:MAG: protein translocase subunit SecF [bacterium]